jgi:hypothetical protein
MPDVSISVASIPPGEVAFYGGIQNGVAVVVVPPFGEMGTEGWVAWHEAGHAVLDVASKLSHTSTDDILTAYWSLRGFPGTWQEAQRKAEAAVAAGESGYQVHQMWPQEMFADTFAATHVESFADGTVFPGIAFDHARMRAFYANLPFYVPTLVVTKALGPLQGTWAFASRAGSFSAPFGQLPYPGRSEIWAAPLGGATIPRYVATYVSNIGPGRPDTNDLSRALSPDGKRIVISAGIGLNGTLRYALVVIDLETGANRLLSVDAAYDDVSPSWSPDGSRIAFARWTTADLADAGTWLVAPDGSGLRRLAEPNAAGKTLVYGWTADGRGVAVGADLGGRYAVIDVTSGGATAFSGYATGAGAWRVGSPAFVGPFADDRFSPPHLDVADGPGASRRTLVRSTAGTLSRPRWRPGSDEFLYVTTAPGSGSIGLAGLSGAPRTIPSRGDVALAEWAPSGEVLYVSTDSPLESRLRITAADGSSARDVVSIPRLFLTWDETYRGLATFAYR